MYRNDCVMIIISSHVCVLKMFLTDNYNLDKSFHNTYFSSISTRSSVAPCQSSLILLHQKNQYHFIRIDV